MTEYRNKTFTREVVELDGHSFFDCTFINCSLSYGGGPVEIGHITITGNTDEFPIFVVHGPAAGIITLLQKLMAGNADGSARMALLRSFGLLPN